jgi:ribosomal protein L31E
MRLTLHAPLPPPLPQEANPAWEKFGFRGQVAKLLWERGLKAKAIRFANCNCLGRPGVCQLYPLEHKFFVQNGCEVIFCRECAKAARQTLFVAYLEVIRNAVLEFADERLEFDRLSAIISDRDEGPVVRTEAEQALRSLWSRVARRISDAGWVLARVNFTIWSDGREIIPDRVKKMNAAVRFTMRRSVVIR